MSNYCRDCGNAIADYVAQCEYCDVPEFGYAYTVETVTVDAFDSELTHPLG